MAQGQQVVKGALADVRAPKKDRFVPPEDRPDVRFGRFTEEGIPRISPSQVNTLLMCPARWAYHYLEGRPSKGSYQAIVGNLAHALMEHAITTLDDPIGPRELETAAHIATEVHLREPATLAGASNGAEARVDRLSQDVGKAVRAAWEWLLDKDPVIEAVEEPIMGTYRVEGQRVDALNILDVRMEVGGQRRIVDWKFPGRAPWVQSGVVDAREGYRRAMQMYGHACDGAAIPADEAWIVHAPLDGSGQVLVAKESLDAARSEAARDDVHRAIRRILDQRLGPDPRTPGPLCSRRWCDHYDVCPAVAAR